jgi:hypothetical protein
MTNAVSSTPDRSAQQVMLRPSAVVTRAMG